ncbi:hypothetical protein GCM10007901_27260 [Dyella acidisoli]|uniref:Methyl-accepting transducer domain-containing protein n=1 Tax=Dyella acidisoli TaxID=1867834 RepID=A0ABQ5XPV5_9GAMM|nr:hypothetical protein GCM10007901_27260 [Dyella acidisoli]
MKKVVDIVDDIAAAGQERSGGIKQVNRAVMQMDEATKQNAALVEEAAAAARAMQEQADRLHAQMEYFRVHGVVHAAAKGISARKPIVGALAAIAE